MQPSYAQDMGVGSIQHGFYGSMMNGLGSIVGSIGMIPCCPCPNPFKDVRKYYTTSPLMMWLMKRTRISRSSIPVRSILQVCWSRTCKGQRLFRDHSSCRYVPSWWHTIYESGADEQMSRSNWPVSQGRWSRLKITSLSMSIVSSAGMSFRLIEPHLESTMSEPLLLNELVCPAFPLLYLSKLMIRDHPTTSRRRTSSPISNLWSRRSSSRGCRDCKFLVHVSSCHIAGLILDRSNSREMGCSNWINLTQRYQFLCRTPTIPLVRCYPEANWWI